MKVKYHNYNFNVEVENSSLLKDKIKTKVGKSRTVLGVFKSMDSRDEDIILKCIKSNLIIKVYKTESGYLNLIDAYALIIKIDRSGKVERKLRYVCTVTDKVGFYVSIDGKRLGENSIDKLNLICLSKVHAVHCFNKLNYCDKVESAVSLISTIVMYLLHKKVNLCDQVSNMSFKVSPRLILPNGCLGSESEARKKLNRSVGKLLKPTKGKS